MKKSGKKSKSKDKKKLAEKKKGFELPKISIPKLSNPFAKKSKKDEQKDRVEEPTKDDLPKIPLKKFPNYDPYTLKRIQCCCVPVRCGIVLLSVYLVVNAILKIQIHRILKNREYQNIANLTMSLDPILENLIKQYPSETDFQNDWNSTMINTTMILQPKPVNMTRQEMMKYQHNSDLYLDQVRYGPDGVMGKGMCKYMKAQTVAAHIKTLTQETLVGKFQDQSTNFKSIDDYTCPEVVQLIYDYKSYQKAYTLWMIHLFMTLVSLIPQFYVVYMLTKYTSERVDGVMDNSDDRKMLPGLMSLLIFNEAGYSFLTSIPLIMYFGFNEGLLYADWDVLLQSFIHVLFYVWYRGSFKQYYDQLYHIDLAAMDEEQTPDVAVNTYSSMFDQQGVLQS